MANTLYDESRRLFLEAGINWMTDDIKAVLVDAGSYTPNFVSHQHLADIGQSARVTPGVLLTGKATTGGAADANDVTFSAVSGPSIEAIVLYRDSGSDATSTLIAWLDTATGLPITPNGGDIIVTWDNGANKIFRL
jgi:hypothetical protein